ncbi:hypothetical protein ACH61_02584 [Rathayibacter tanaceti]|uniref:Uncharacterized protein n=2 Tax=Rathayibacter tanaceti TaxID=1671680 RepID=A0A162FVT7_9MICO|nr:hypothetical protein ACH61_02584 [Rathayibacter tanaceti]
MEWGPVAVKGGPGPEDDIMNERHEPAERELPTQPDGDAAHLAPTVSVPAESIRADENRALRLDDRRRRRRALIAGGAGLAVLIAVAAGGVAYAGSTEAPASASPNATTTVYPGDSRGAFGGGVAVSPYGGGTAGGSPRPDSATTTASARRPRESSPSPPTSAIRTRGPRAPASSSPPTA